MRFLATVGIVLLLLLGAWGIIQLAFFAGGHIIGEDRTKYVVCPEGARQEDCYHSRTIFHYRGGGVQLDNGVEVHGNFTVKKYDN